MRAPRRPTRLLVAGLLLLGAGVLAGCDGLGSGADDQRPTGASDRSGAGRSAGGPSASGTGEPSDEASPGPSGSSDTADTSGTAGTVTVPVYFVGDTPAGPRLFREFRRVPAGDPVGAALDLAASGDALDPDYRTLLPSGDFDGREVRAGSTIDVTLPDDSWTRLPSGTSESEALLAVQQLVYTAQGVLQSRAPVTFTDSSGSATQVLGIASEDGFPAAAPLRTLALVNITAPEQGQTVGSRFTASGVASSFEANVPWEVRDSSGAVVLRGAATAEGWTDRLYPWQTGVDLSSLSPGTYTFVASTDDPSDGEGPGPTRDTKTITVR